MLYKRQIEIVFNFILSSLEIIESIAVIVASIIAIYSLNSWRREAKWKRKYELAEEALALFYIAKHRLEQIRSPLGFTSEGDSRPKEDYEELKEKKILNTAYIPRERFEKDNEPFLKLQALKFRFITVFGKETAKYFDGITILLHEIFWAAKDIAEIQLGEKEFVDRKEKGEEVKRLNRIVYLNYSKPQEDLHGMKISNLIEEIEQYCNKIIKEK